MVFRRRAVGSTAYSSTGFARFFDDIVMHGLEIIGLYYGSYRAEVVNNEDPDVAGQPDPFGRLTVLIPAVDGGSRLNERLAWPIVPLGGPGYGLKTLPPVGGYVWVEFENGRVDLPMWKGGWFAEDDLPDDLKPTEAHGWFTPGGHQILMDEQTGQEFVRIKHSNGHEIFLNGASGQESIQIKHKDGSTLIELDSQGSIFLTNNALQKVNIGDGADTANEPAVLGSTLKGLLEQIVDAIMAMQITTSLGPQAPLNIPQFAAIRGQLQTMLSQTVNVK